MKTLDPQPLVDVARTVANFRRQTFDYNDDERDEARLFLRMLYAAWPPWQYGEAGVVAALVAVGFTHIEAAELAIALGELRKGKDRRVTQLIATLSARYHFGLLRTSGGAAWRGCIARPQRRDQDAGSRLAETVPAAIKGAFGGYSTQEAA
jgi:hypothetical protein